jgi:hypothetical protein
MGSIRHPLAILAVALAMSALSACAGTTTAPSPSPTWTPAPGVTAGPRSFPWASPTELRGKLLPEAWTTTASFTLPEGPATVVGVLKVPWLDVAQLHGAPAGAGHLIQTSPSPGCWPHGMRIRDGSGVKIAAPA